MDAIGERTGPWLREHLGSDQPGIEGQGKRSVGEPRVGPDLRFRIAAAPQLGGEARLGGGIVGADVVRARRRLGPTAVQLVGHRVQLALVAAVVADQHHVAEACVLQAHGGRDELGAEDSGGHGDRAREFHVFRRRVDVAFRHIGDHRRHERPAQAARDPVGEDAHPHIMLAQGHVRPALLDAADGNDDHRGAGGDLPSQLRPRQIFQEHRARRAGMTHGRRPQGAEHQQTAPTAPRHAPSSSQRTGTRSRQPGPERVVRRPSSGQGSRRWDASSADHQSAIAAKRRLELTASS